MANTDYILQWALCCVKGKSPKHVFMNKRWQQSFNWPIIASFNEILK